MENLKKLKTQELASQIYWATEDIYAILRDGEWHVLDNISKHCRERGLPTTFMSVMRMHVLDHHHGKKDGFYRWKIDAIPSDELTASIYQEMIKLKKQYEQRAKDKLKEKKLHEKRSEAQKKAWETRRQKEQENGTVRLELDGLFDSGKELEVSELSKVENGGITKREIPKDDTYLQRKVKSITVTDKDQSVELPSKEDITVKDALEVVSDIKDSQDEYFKNKIMAKSEHVKDLRSTAVRAAKNLKKVGEGISNKKGKVGRLWNKKEAKEFIVDQNNKKSRVEISVLWGLFKYKKG